MFTRLNMPGASPRSLWLTSTVTLKVPVWGSTTGERRATLPVKVRPAMASALSSAGWPGLMRARAFSGTYSTASNGSKSVTTYTASLGVSVLPTLMRRLATTPSMGERITVRSRFSLAMSLVAFSTARSYFTASKASALISLRS